MSNSHKYHHNITAVCPHCDHENEVDDICEYEPETEHEYECYECCKTFIFTYCYSGPYFNTYKPEECE